MGWFDNQIKSRREADQQLLDDSFVKIAGVVMGQRSAEKLGDERIITKNAIDEVLKYYEDMLENTSHEFSHESGRPARLLHEASRHHEA